ncbi:hypothetical protein [Agriterribacter sp.]|uniref:hypothetical protein n=1 Tax=Agriterribacter sp. TaxID=2821509 RepID=UPI002BB86B1F|nr:hypothetical protein [Agriterribacter sp.]HRO45207.1 hypothetical protein [Agriterribacter sp.]HRQ16810.1 hypothetical protein [Agriterribacter sp.]
MKKEDIPQDPSALQNVTKEVSYAVDENGKYVTELSAGWDVKIKALDVAWSDIEKKVAGARQKVLNKEASPLLYFMELKLMDIEILSAYTGFWKWQVKRHLKPSVFEKLSAKKLQRYATAFDVTVEALKNVNWNETGV